MRGGRSSALRVVLVARSLRSSGICSRGARRRGLWASRFRVCVLWPVSGKGSPIRALVAKGRAWDVLVCTWHRSLCEVALRLLEYWVSAGGLGNFQAREKRRD